MNKTIIAIVVAAVVFVGGYFLFRGAPQPTPSVSQPLASESPTPEPTLPPSVSESPTQQPSLQPSAKQSPTAKENVVTYTDSGYSPATLTIKKGETATFKNQSARSMWTASAVHPTHRAYLTSGGCIGSTFDACSGIQPGASWSFKFDISGAWKYHNHLSPGDTGAIVVE